MGSCCNVSDKVDGDILVPPANAPNENGVKGSANYGQ